MTQELRSRWKNDPVYIDLLRNGVLQAGLPMGMDRKTWYKTFAPLIATYIPQLSIKSLDCRYIDISSCVIGGQSLGYILDFGIIRNSLFLETEFQDGTAKEADFRGSRFVHSHMTPFYAKDAKFEDCVFIKCFFTGITAGIARNNLDEMFFGVPTDLVNCCFVRAIGDRTDFDRCDFRGANFTEAYFEECRFDESDLRGVKFESTRFVKCNFSNAWLSDTAENRDLVARGENKNIEQIHWKPVNS